MIKIDKGIPAHIVSKALIELTKLAEKQISVRKTKRNKSESLEVGRNYRLFRKDSSSKWLLVSHEKYNRLLTK